MQQRKRAKSFSVGFLSSFLCRQTALLEDSRDLAVCSIFSLLFHAWQEMSWDFMVINHLEVQSPCLEPPRYPPFGDVEIPFGEKRLNSKLILDIFKFIIGQLVLNKIDFLLLFC